MPAARARVEAAGLAASLASVGAIAAAGSVPTARGLPWYRGLDRPAWTPPDAVFGPAWAVLYASQAVAAWLVWKGDWRRAEYDVPAMTAYGVQLALNLAWTFLFFGLRRPAWALAEACVLWLAVATTVREFARKHRVAAAMLLPYLAWVSFATALTASIWRRNR